MLINDIENKEQLYKIVLNSLKNHGIKYNKPRKGRLEQKNVTKRIFGIQLDQLELSSVILANGSVVQIPRFVADACKYILENVSVEGIFRKAGSAARQKEIRSSLENGATLGRSHHVIDIANVLKFFIRELPDPLIPTPLQHTLLRCFLSGEQQRNNCILLACLLLPTLNANTLAFFMQFLQTVASSVADNKMSAENLAIIFTPSIMPCFNVNSTRFNNHMKIVQLLIELSDSIGIVPKMVLQKLTSHETACKKQTPHKPAAFDLLKSAKQKRRTELFTGIKKLVSSSRSDLLDLEQTPLKNNAPKNSASCSVKKKRKLVDASNTPKERKQRTIALETQKSPATRKAKMPRASLGGTTFVKNIMNNPVSANVERRWSLVGPSWSKRRIKPFASFELDKTLPTIEDILPQTINDEATDIKIPHFAEDRKDDMIQNVEPELSTETQLAQGLEQKLKICTQREHLNTKVVACSPRVRKMGVQRQHKIGLTRTQTWHINTNTKALMTEALLNKNITVPVCKSKPRTRLSTKNKNEKENEKMSIEEDWTPADSFFKPVKCNKMNSQLEKELDSIENIQFQTPKATKLPMVNTPVNDSAMLPPRRLPVQRFKTPKGATPLTANSLTPYTPLVDDNGRASIARLRQQNAGMVMAKAKLFDGLVDGNIQCHRTPKKAVHRVRDHVNSAKKITH